MVDTGSGINMVDDFFLNISSLDQNISIAISPNLTKIYYQYTIYKTTTPICVIKTIDYNQLYLFDVNITSWVNTFININSSSTQYFALGDQYLVIRNDTSNNIAAVTSNPALQLLEVGFEFINTNMVFVASRILTNAEYGMNSRIFIDGTSPNLLIYEFISKYRIVNGFYVKQYNFNTFTGVTPLPSILTSSMLTELNHSSTSQLFISTINMISM
jgi:hypothetical protein